MNTKFTLAIIALIGIGVFALPSTMSLFSGQHTFYNIDATGNQVPCAKCHGDVKAELSGSMATAGSGAPHAKFQCEYCHRAEAGFASGDDALAVVRYRNVANESYRLYLLTSISNFEGGNFPKYLTYDTTLTVHNWDDTTLNPLKARKADNLTQWLNNTALLIDGEYTGSLSNAAVAGEYKYYDTGGLVNLRNSNGTLKTNMTDNYFEEWSGITWTSNTAYTIAPGSGSNLMTPGQTYHAASLVSCLECHGGEQQKGAAGYEVVQSQPYNHRSLLASSCGNCHYGGGEWVGAMAAGGFQAIDGLGLTTGSATEGSLEAHNEFVVADPNGVLRGPGTGYGSNNIACVACHTHVAVDINFQKAYKVQFDAVNTATGSWTVDNFLAEGQVNVAIYGNGSGATYATGDKSYTWGGANMYVNGATVKTTIGLDGDSSDNTTALTT
ncbi:MAG: hypothetical protein OIN87_07215 [Candidatus Methanoperedens sp.]|nr:hypothetical protein [Candidatus Methanoperedens sp.]